MSEMSKIQIRLPKSLKKWIEEQSGINGSSQNSEVIRAVRERMDRVNETKVEPN